MIDWCSKNGHDITLIEVMPMGDIGGENRYIQYLPLSDVRSKLEKNLHLLICQKELAVLQDMFHIKEKNRPWLYYTFNSQFFVNHVIELD